jgi:hypothetical protein
MEAGCTLFHPLLSLCQWIVAKASDLVVITLMQTNTTALQKVNGGDDLHDAHGTFRSPHPAGQGGALQWLG